MNEWKMEKIIVKLNQESDVVLKSEIFGCSL